MIQPSLHKQALLLVGSYDQIHHTDSHIPYITTNIDIGMDMQIHPTWKHTQNIEVKSRMGASAYSHGIK
jgi:hypothetical protein